MGDVDADGHDDILIGAYNNSDGGLYAGAAYLVLGRSTPVGGSLSAADACYIGEDLYDYAGWSVSGAGDIDSDGRDDLLIGAYGSDDGGSLDSGAAYLILGAGPWAAAAQTMLATAVARDYNPRMDPSFDHMTLAERVLYVQDLWDRIAAEPDGVPLSEAQRLELRRRVDEHRADPGSAVPWEQVLARARAR